MTSPKRLMLILKSLRVAIFAGLLVVLLAVSAPGAVLADANLGRQEALAQLDAALAKAPAQERLADLTRLKDAITASTDRAQISNESSHQIGLFARYKKADPLQAAEFYVLAPGHRTDDDFEPVALLIPPAVGLDWTANRLAADPSAARLLTILSGEQLTISDPEPTPVSSNQPATQSLSQSALQPALKSALQTGSQAGSQSVQQASAQPTGAAKDQSLTYQLNLPPFQVNQQVGTIASLPRINQAELDAALETAPLD